MAKVLKNCLARLDAATATCWLVGWVSQFGLIRGVSDMFALASVMLPREIGANRTGWMYPTSIGFSRVEKDGVPKGAEEIRILPLANPKGMSRDYRLLSL